MSYNKGTKTEAFTKYTLLYQLEMKSMTCFVPNGQSFQALLQFLQAKRLTEPQQREESWVIRLLNGLLRFLKVLVASNHHKICLDV
jgi:hypothetical protein